MKDFVKDNWKIAAACSAGAFVLSLVVGLLARNPFGIALLRAFLLAALFAGLGAGLRFVVRAYLPELLAAPTAADGPAGRDDGRGASVNIVLPEENGVRPARMAARTARGQPAEEAGAGEEDAIEEALEGDEESVSRAEAQAIGELAEEFAEELPPASESADATESAGHGTGADAADETEAEEPAAGKPSWAAESAGDLDSLPDIADLEPTAERKSNGSAARTPRVPGAAEKPEDAMKEVLSGQDPATLARALRTVLKKDEKG